MNSDLKNKTFTNWQICKKFFSVLFARYKIIWILVFVGVGIHRVLSFVPDYLVKLGIDKGSEFIGGILSKNDYIEYLLLLIIIYFVAMFFQTTLGLVKDRVYFIYLRKQAVELKQKLYSHLLDLDHKFWTKTHNGSIFSAQSRGINSFSMQTNIFIQRLLPQVISLITSVIIIVVIVKAALLIAVLVIAIMFIWSYWLQQKITKIVKKRNEAADKETGFFADGITNVQAIKNFGKESFMMKLYKLLIDDTESKNLEINAKYVLMQVLNGLMNDTGVGLILVVSFWGFLNGEISIGSLFFVYASASQLINSFSALNYTYQDLAQHFAHMDKMFVLLEQKAEIIDDKNATELKVSEGNIKFEEITFGYNEDRKIFNQLSLNILPGERWLSSVRPV